MVGLSDWPKVRVGVSCIRVVRDVTLNHTRSFEQQVNTPSLIVVVSVELGILDWSLRSPARFETVSQDEVNAFVRFILLPS